MEFKEELGQKIQSLREEKGLSRQAICGEEDILTTRQLQRIEKGQSLPTIATALYIAEQLEVSLDRLANRERFESLGKALSLWRWRTSSTERRADRGNLSEVFRSAP